MARYHTSGDGALHPGSQVDCAKCKRAASKKVLQKRGSAGGKKAQANVTPARTCSGCGKKIARQNVTGMCINCLRKHQGNVTKAKEELQRHCSSCSKRISKYSKTGLCVECVRNLPGSRQARQEIQDFLTAGSFKRSVRPDS